MKLYIKKQKTKKWGKPIEVSEYNISEWVLKFCKVNDVQKCDFKITGTVTMNAEIVWLPALFRE